MKIIRYGYNAQGLFMYFINYLWLALVEIQNGKYSLNIQRTFRAPFLKSSARNIDQNYPSPANFTG